MGKRARRVKGRPERRAGSDAARKAAECWRILAASRCGKSPFGSPVWLLSPRQITQFVANSDCGAGERRDARPSRVKEALTVFLTFSASVPNIGASPAGDFIYAVHLRRSRLR